MSGSEVMLENMDLQSILPHRYPFLLVDRVVELSLNQRVVGIKNVSVNEPFFQGHFPGRPIFPGVLIIEALAQLGGVLAIKSSLSGSRPIVYLTGVDKFKFRKPVFPGDQLRLEVEVVRRRNAYWRMYGKAFVGSELVTEGESTAMVTTELSVSEASSDSTG